MISVRSNLPCFNRALDRRELLGFERCVNAPRALLAVQQCLSVALLCAQSCQQQSNNSRVRLSDAMPEHVGQFFGLIIDFLLPAIVIDRFHCQQVLVQVALCIIGRRQDGG